MTESQRDLTGDGKNDIWEQFGITPQGGAWIQEIIESRPLMVAARKSLMQRMGGGAGESTSLMIPGNKNFGKE